MFCTNNKIPNKISSTQIAIAKTLSEVNIAVTGSCEGSLGHQVEQSHDENEFTLNMLFISGTS